MVKTYLIKIQLENLLGKDLIYYSKGNTAMKKFDDFKNGIKLFEKIKSGDMKLE